jgi:hypothetical protein
MPYLKREYLYRPTTTPEQMNFIENFYNTFDSGDVHKKIVNVEPLFFQGAIAGTEFLTYVNNKLYVCLFAYFSGDATMVPSVLTVNMYNEVNTEIGRFNNNVISNANQYANATLKMNNFYFSRIITTGYLFIIFNGYRITLN